MTLFHHEFGHRQLGFRSSNFFPRLLPQRQGFFVGFARACQVSLLKLDRTQIKQGKRHFLFILDFSGQRQRFFIFFTRAR